MNFFMNFFTIFGIFIAALLLTLIPFITGCICQYYISNTFNTDTDAQKFWETISGGGIALVFTEFLVLIVILVHCVN